ncbi:VAMP726 protein [Hibiscus syriacus]|uniref:VAMP726 protein n=1 Tax=Hibiscus syriacus TaxID=106335 RepID=A0A6A2YF07_HIBSY|nr:VAMP726 protein [Hibiscus syriacus]
MVYLPCILHSTFVVKQESREKGCGREDTIRTYCVVADQSAGRQIPIAFLERIKDDFVSKYGSGKAATAPANSLNKEFRPKLKEHMQYFIEHPEEISKFAKVKAQVSEVKGVMMENIEKVSDRGEKIELLVDKTENLHHQIFEVRGLKSKKNVVTKHEDQAHCSGNTDCLDPHHCPLYLPRFQLRKKMSGFISFHTSSVRMLLREICHHLGYLQSSWLDILKQSYNSSPRAPPTAGTLRLGGEAEHVRPLGVGVSSFGKWSSSNVMEGYQLRMTWLESEIEVTRDSTENENQLGLGDFSISISRAFQGIYCRAWSKSRRSRLSDTATLLCVVSVLIFYAEYNSPLEFPLVERWRHKIIDTKLSGATTKYIWIRIDIVGRYAREECEQHQARFLKSKSKKKSSASLSSSTSVVEDYYHASQASFGFYTSYYTSDVTQSTWVGHSWDAIQHTSMVAKCSIGRQMLHRSPSAPCDKASSVAVTLLSSLFPRCCSSIGLQVLHRSSCAPGDLWRSPCTPGDLWWSL